MTARVAPERSDRSFLNAVRVQFKQGKKQTLCINVKLSIISREEEERERYSKLWIGKVGNTKSTVHMNIRGIFQTNEQKPK